MSEYQSFAAAVVLHASCFLWDLGKAGGLHDGVLLYWLRFLNIIFIVNALAWLGYVAARIMFP